MTPDNHDRPLQGLLVLDFCQFLSGPLATLRLADMGARVVKIERPGSVSRTNNSGLFTPPILKGIGT